MTIREIQSILVQRGFGVGFVVEKFTLLEKKYFYKKKMEASWKKINFMALQSQLNTQTHKYGVFLVRVHQNKKKEM